jgi:NitT/TauT family transport system substrate-binding protein
MERGHLGAMCVGLLAAILALGSIASAADTASLRLNWYLGGLHSPFYLGVERGFYRDEGIDLTLN